MFYKKNPTQPAHSEETTSGWRKLGAVILGALVGSDVASWTPSAFMSGARQLAYTDGFLERFNANDVYLLAGPVSILEIVIFYYIARYVEEYDALFAKTFLLFFVLSTLGNSGLALLMGAIALITWIGLADYLMGDMSLR